MAALRGSYARRDVEVVSGRGDTATRSRTVIMEFNGTQFVPITINELTCTLDLARRSVSCEWGSLAQSRAARWPDRWARARLSAAA